MDGLPVAVGLMEHRQFDVGKCTWRRAYKEGSGTLWNKQAVEAKGMGNGCEKHILHLLGERKGKERKQHDWKVQNFEK